MCDVLLSLRYKLNGEDLQSQNSHLEHENILKNKDENATSCSSCPTDLLTVAPPGLSRNDVILFIMSLTCLCWFC